MSDRTRSGDYGGPASDGEGADPRAATPPSPPGNGHPEVEPEEPATLGQALHSIAQLRADLADRDAQLRGAEDRQLRDRAELENFKRRMQRERSEALRYASEGLIRDLLPVVDNMERAVRAAAEARSSGAGETSPAADALVTGVEMVLRQLREVLERAGATRIPVPPGQAFDPTVHEAVVQVESSSVPPGAVVDELVPGYRLHERLLRPAQVSVAKPASRLEN
jgi:molecular chaperone GrpE